MHPEFEIKMMMMMTMTTKPNRNMQMKALSESSNQPHLLIGEKQITEIHCNMQL